MSDMPVIVGLTGGIASGKSTVSDMFRALGVPVIDADVLAREVVEPGEPALDEIRDEFGDEVIAEDGSLSRDALGEIIFDDDDARAALEQITHPRIASRMLEKAGKAGEDGHDWVIYDAALLVENRLHAAFHALIVVSASESTQISRIVDRDGLSPEAARKRIRAQMPLEDKIEVADYVIDNDGTLQETREQVQAIFEELDREIRDTDGP